MRKNNGNNFQKVRKSFIWKSESDHETAHQKYSNGKSMYRTRKQFLVANNVRNVISFRNTIFNSHLSIYKYFIQMIEYFNSLIIEPNSSSSIKISLFRIRLSSSIISIRVSRSSLEPLSSFEFWSL